MTELGRGNAKQELWRGQIPSCNCDGKLSFSDCWTRCQAMTQSDDDDVAQYKTKQEKQTNKKK